MVERFAEWKAAGFRIHLIGVTIDPAEAMARASLRAISSGRWVPNDMLVEAHRGFNGAVKAIWTRWMPPASMTTPRQRLMKSPQKGALA